MDFDKHRIYIDETGNSDLKSSDNPNHRFLSLTGVIISLVYVKNHLHADMEKLKQEFFSSHPDDPIIFHRKEMVNKQSPFHILKKQSIEKKFNFILLEKLNEWTYTVISVIVDKKEHRDLYRTWQYDPYHYCLAVMLERYIMFLEENKVIGDVMIESRGKKEDTRLKKSFSELYTKGTQYIDSESFKKYFTSSKLKVKPKSNNISGLQLADIIAHPSRNDMLKKFGFKEKKNKTFGDKIINILEKKYHRSKEGKIIGYGIKKLP